MNRIVKIRNDMTPVRYDFKIYKGEDSVMRLKIPIGCEIGSNLKAYLRRNERSTNVLAKMTLAPLKETESIVLSAYKDRQLSENDKDTVVEVDVVNSVDVQLVDMILSAKDSNKLITNMYQKSFHYDVFSDGHCIAYGEIDVIGAVSNRGDCTCDDNQENEIINVENTEFTESTDFLVIYKLERGN